MVNNNQKKHSDYFNTVGESCEDEEDKNPPTITVSDNNEKIIGWSVMVALILTKLLFLTVKMIH